MTDLDKLRTLAEAATPEPWEATTNEATMNDRSQYRFGPTIRPAVFFGHQMREADAAYVEAANPAAVLALLDRIDLLSEALAQYCQCPQPEDPEGCYCPTDLHEDGPGDHRKDDKRRSPVLTMLDHLNYVRAVQALHQPTPWYTAPCEHLFGCECIELNNGDWYDPDIFSMVCETCSGGSCGRWIR